MAPQTSRASAPRSRSAKPPPAVNQFSSIFTTLEVHFLHLVCLLQGARRPGCFASTALFLCFLALGRLPRRCLVLLGAALSPVPVLGRLLAGCIRVCRAGLPRLCRLGALLELRLDPKPLLRCPSLEDFGPGFANRPIGLKHQEFLCVRHLGKCLSSHAHFCGSVFCLLDDHLELSSQGLRTTMFTVFPQVQHDRRDQLGERRRLAQQSQMVDEQKAQTVAHNLQGER
mmetsp:Transcript_27760/g.70358  ORF Transcript_27760/g.70358 Transcript_27760/m.70358 type:complete len:228 (+) Transcript_27760:132-815(+)